MLFYHGIQLNLSFQTWKVPRLLVIKNHLPFLTADVCREWRSFPCWGPGGAGCHTEPALSGAPHAALCQWDKRGSLQPGGDDGLLLLPAYLKQHRSGLWWKHWRIIIKHTWRSRCVLQMCWVQQVDGCVLHTNTWACVCSRGSEVEMYSNLFKAFGLRLKTNYFKKETITCEWFI